MGYAMLNLFDTEEKAKFYRKGYIDGIEQALGRPEDRERYVIFKEEDGRYSVNFD